MRYVGLAGKACAVLLLWCDFLDVDYSERCTYLHSTYSAFCSSATSSLRKTNQQYFVGFGNYSDSLLESFH